MVASACSFTSSVNCVTCIREWDAPSWCNPHLYPRAKNSNRIFGCSSGGENRKIEQIARVRNARIPRTPKRLLVGKNV